MVGDQEVARSTRGLGRRVCGCRVTTTKCEGPFMKRCVLLGTLIVAGALSITVAAFQQPSQPAAKTIDVDKIKDNLYMLKGGGGNTAVFITDKGVVVVDTKNPGWGQPILDKI